MGIPQGDESHGGDQLETEPSEAAETNVESSPTAIVEEPCYSIVYRGYIDFQDYTAARLETSVLS